MHRRVALYLVAAVLFGACQPQPEAPQQPLRARAPSPITAPDPPEPEPQAPAPDPNDPAARRARALSLPLAADLGAITPAQRAILDQIIAAAPTGDLAAAAKRTKTLQKSPLVVVDHPSPAEVSGSTLHIALIDVAATAELTRHHKRLAELERGLPIPEHLRRAPPASAPAPLILDLLYRSDQFPLDLPARLHAADGAPLGPLRNLERAEFEALIKPLGERALAPAHHPHLDAELFAKAIIPARELAYRVGPAEATIGGAPAPLQTALGAAYLPLERAKADVIAHTALAAGLLDSAPKDSSIQPAALAATYVAALLHHARPGGPEHPRLAARLQLGRYAEEAVFRFDAEQRLVIDPERLAAAAAQLVTDIVQIEALGSELRGVGFLERYGRLSLELAALLDRHHDLPRELLPRYPLSPPPTSPAP